MQNNNKRSPLGGASSLIGIVIVLIYAATRNAAVFVFVPIVIAIVVAVVFKNSKQQTQQRPPAPPNRYDINTDAPIYRQQTVQTQRATYAPPVRSTTSAYQANPHLCEDDSHARDSGESTADVLQSMDSSYTPYQRPANTYSSMPSLPSLKLSAQEKREKKAEYQALVEAGLMSKEEYRKFIRELD